MHPARQALYLFAVIRVLGFAVFFLVAWAILGGAHWYVWTRLIRDLDWPSAMGVVITLVEVLFFLALPVSILATHLANGGWVRTFSMLAWSWFGFLFILVLLLVSVDAGRLVLQAMQSLLPDLGSVEFARQRFLARVTGGAVVLAALVIGLVALRQGLGQLVVRRIQVSLERLPEAFNGTTVVQLSDVHVGTTIKKGFVEKMVTQTNSLRPDLIVITGDLVDGSVASLRDEVAPLRDLRARYGVYFVTGNHEFYSGARAWCDELEKLGIRVLRNERVEIGEGDASFDLVGVHDYAGARNGQGPDLKGALAGRDPNRELVLLAHQPKQIKEAACAGVGLQLSGHTHGGQIWPWHYLVTLVQPVVAGLQRFDRTWLYVSSGTGYWGPPMRLGAPPEITQVILLSLQKLDS